MDKKITKKSEYCINDWMKSCKDWKVNSVKSYQGFTQMKITTNPLDLARRRTDNLRKKEICKEGGCKLRASKT